MTDPVRIAHADNSVFESGDVLHGILQTSKTTNKGYWLHRIDDVSFIGLESLAEFESDLVRVVVEDPDPTTEICVGKGEVSRLRHAPRIRCESVVERLVGLDDSELGTRRDVLRQEAESLQDTCETIRDEILPAYRALDELVEGWEGVDGPISVCRKYVESADRVIGTLESAADGSTEKIKAHEAEARSLKNALNPKWNELLEDLSGDTLYYLREEFDTLDESEGAEAKKQYDLLRSLLRQLC